jgi:hypothetical protein
MGECLGGKWAVPPSSRSGVGEERIRCVVLKKDLRFGSLRKKKFINGVYTSYDYVIRMIYTYEL